MSEGLQADDPGVRMLGRVLAGVDPREILLVHCGALPGVRSGARRLVLDVRELAEAGRDAVPADDAAALAALPRVQHAAVWPRAHLGKDFTFACLAQGALALARGGTLWCAARKHKGAESLADHMVALLGNVDIVERDRGYRLMRSAHEGRVDEALARACIDQRYLIEDPVLGALRLHSAPGVFSRRGLDDGTRALIEHVDAWAHDQAAPTHVIDLCAGIGPLALWAAQRWSQARVLAVESNFVAAGAMRENIAAAGVGDRVTALVRDGLPREAGAETPPLHGVQVALVNPPTHAERGALIELLRGLGRWMAPGGHAFVVASRAGVSSEGLREAGARVHAAEADGYAILRASWDLGAGT
ncbi:MAG: methyltransferase [Nannocystaceae bacterium]|nr:methyltransferase [Nannocystaceae bacterium]